jgi:hypothetical protein
MKILSEAGRNKHGQRLVRVECACGRIVEPVIYNNIKNGRTKTCGKCHLPLTPKAVVVSETEITPEIASQHERGSVAWLSDEISRKERALVSAENHIRFLELQIIQQESTDLDTLKKRKTEATSANDLRGEIARLRNEKDSKETGVVKVAKSQAELTRERIAALEGK